MYKIRQGTTADFKKLNQDLAWGNEPWARKGQREYIKGIQAQKQELWVIEKGEELIGEIHIHWNQDNSEEADGKNRAYLSALRLHPNHRGQGIGTKLIERIFKRIKAKDYNEVTIAAYHHEPQIQELYKKWGFTEFVKDGVEETTGGKISYMLLLKKL